VTNSENGPPCKRPYELGRRLAASDQTREAVLAAARAQLESGGVRDVTMESLARAAGVTRQTIHNLFGTRAALLEALFDRLALNAGMGRMREVFMAPDGESMLARMVEVFSGFWSRERQVLRKIRAIAAIEPDFGEAVKARDQRRHQIAERVVERLIAPREGLTQEERSLKIAALVALTSFEFFDAFADSCGDAGQAKAWMIPVIRRAMGAP